MEAMLTLDVPPRRVASLRFSSAWTAMSPNGPKLRLENVCYSAAVRLGGKQTLGELPEKDAHDPKETSALSIPLANGGVIAFRSKRGDHTVASIRDLASRSGDQMRRREFCLALSAVTATVALSARAQKPL